MATGSGHRPAELPWQFDNSPLRALGKLQQRHPGIFQVTQWTGMHPRIQEEAKDKQTWRDKPRPRRQQQRMPGVLPGKLAVGTQRQFWVLCAWCSGGSQARVAGVEDEWCVSAGRQGMEGIQAESSSRREMWGGG